MSRNLRLCGIGKQGLPGRGKFEEECYGNGGITKEDYIPTEPKPSWMETRTKW